MRRHPWKRELTKLANDLNKKFWRKDWSTRMLATVEKNVYWSFLIIRKLLESGAAPPTQVPITSFLPRDDGGLHRPRDQMWDAQYLCNEMIHSAFFAFGRWDDGTLKGFVFCSGRKAHLRYVLDFYAFISLLEHIGKSSDGDVPTPTIFTWAKPDEP